VEKRALGKGLAALLGEKENQSYQKPVALFTKDKTGERSGIQYLEVSKIHAGRLQPRSEFDTEKQKELISSIKEKGLIQPIIVRRKADGYEIIAGERRFRAVKSLGTERMPAIIKDVDDQEALIISLIENIQREQLNPIEEASAFKKLIEDFKVNQDDVAQFLGKDKTTVSNTLRLLKLPDEIQQYLRKGHISFGHAKAILSLDNAQKQLDLCRQIISNSLSVRELESIARTVASKAKKRIRKDSTRDPYLVDLENQLQHLLGTKVRIVANKKRGKIVIEYYSLNDLDRILNLLGKRNKL